MLNYSGNNSKNLPVYQWIWLLMRCRIDQSHEMRDLFFIGIDNPPDIPMVDDPVLKALANLINDNLVALNACRRAKANAKAVV